MQDSEMRSLVERGVRAYRQGQLADAITHFEQIVDAGVADTSLMLVLSGAYRHSGKLNAARTAVERVLKTEPRNIRALILNADLYADATEVKLATTFYMAALKVASVTDALPADLQGELSRAEMYCNAQTARLEANVRKASGVAELIGTSSRFREAVDIMFGRGEKFPQAPRHFFYPDLIRRTFFDSSEFSWVPDLEAATSQIRDELIEVMKTPDSFKPYVERIEQGSGRPQVAESRMTGNSEWSAFYLWKNGELVAENAARCPRTMAALAKLPLTVMPKRSPSVLFSLMKPGAHIPPHNGLINTRLICHLPLVVPPNCEFRVGNDRRSWEEGKVWLFDDSIEHEAWNRSPYTRVILLFEVWRPDIDFAERQGLNSLFDALDNETGRAPDWEI